MKSIILLPVFKRFDLTENFLKSLQAVTTSVEVLVINDGLPGEYSYIVNRGFSIKVTVVDTNGNLYWGGTINYGLDYIKYNLQSYKKVIFANNDIEIPSDFEFSMIENLSVNVIGHPKVYSSVTNRFVSVGIKVILFFPYIKINVIEFGRPNMMTARFLVFPSIFFKEGLRIPPSLPHYHGDYYLTYLAVSKGFRCKVLDDMCVFLKEKGSGLKGDYISTWSDFFSSYTSFKSVNYWKHKLYFFTSIYGLWGVIIYINNILFQFFLFFVKKIFFRD